MFKGDEYDTERQGRGEFLSRVVREAHTENVAVEQRFEQRLKELRGKTTWTCEGTVSGRDNSKYNISKVLGVFKEYQGAWVLGQSN